MGVGFTPTDNSNMARILISSAFSLLSSSTSCSSPHHSPLLFNPSPNSCFFPSPNKVVLRNGGGSNLICHQQSGVTTDKSVLEGVITESVSNGMYLVSLENGNVIVGYVSGKIRQRSIQILPGDKVRIEMSQYDSTKGRITYRTTKDDPERRDLPKTKPGKNRGRRN